MMDGQSNPSATAQVRSNQSRRRQRTSRLAKELQRRLFELARLTEGRIERFTFQELAQALRTSRPSIDAHWEVVQAAAKHAGIAHLLPRKRDPSERLRDELNRARRQLADTLREATELRRKHTRMFSFLIQRGVKSNELIRNLREVSPSSGDDFCPCCGNKLPQEK